jgi:hypothetical protein
MPARLVAGAGAVLAIVGIFVDAIQAISYWNFDGTVAWTGIVLGALALLLVVAGAAGRPQDGWLFAVGAVLTGFWAWIPALTAFDDWDQTRAGVWLCLGGGVLVAAGAAAAILTTAGAESTPSGISFPAIVSAVGIALVFPAIFLDAEQGSSYWDGDGVGILMLILAGLAALVWAATAAGVPTYGLDVALTLVLLGLVAFDPVGSAFNNLGNLEAGAWLGLAGGILAAGGTWSARGESRDGVGARPKPGTDAF